MFEIGTYQWNKRSQGFLSRKEKFRIVGMLVRAQVTDFVQRGRYMLGWSKDALARLDFEAIIRPDSKLALAAEELCEELHSPGLANHCYRTYYWGALLGQVDGFSIDAELLYVGSLLHDMGLSDKHSPQAAHSCFALNGANVAYNLALEHGWNDTQAEAVYNCIGLHLNPLVNATEHGPEAKLLGNGAYLDILGLRHYCLTADVIQRVHQRHPRTDFIPEIVRIMKGIKHPPHTRAGFMSNMGIEFMARRNPLDK